MRRRYDGFRRTRRLRPGASLALLVILFAGLTGCREKKAVPPNAAGPATTTSFVPFKVVPTAGSSDPKDFLTPEGLDVFDLKAHPGATIVQPLDPATLTESERRYGRSPHPDPNVEYQPGIILMEHGDQAIRGIGQNGLTWIFDANAPQVSDFQVGKVVFATGWAVGRILSMKRTSDQVQVVLGPIQIMDVIHKGSFAMDAPLDLTKALPFVTPGYPQTKENDPPENASLLDGPRGAETPQTMVFSRISPSGKWTPVSMAKILPGGRRIGYERIGKHWVMLPQPSALGLGVETPVQTAEDRRPYLTPATYTPAAPRFQPAAYQAVLPGTGLAIPQVPKMQPMQVPAVPTIPNLDITDAMHATVLGKGTSIGVQWTYKRGGMWLNATGMLRFDGAHARFYLDIGQKNAPPVKCGVEISASIGIHLQMLAHSDNNFHIGTQKMQRYWLPASLSIPLAGNVPLSVNFDQAVVLNTGFSAKNSILNAEGDYVFTGGIKADFDGSSFHVHVPESVTGNTDLARSAEGVSVGINSLVMSAELRATAGLGVAGFTTGVYASLIFSGTILRAPDIALPCRAGTIQVWLYPGLGYSIPGWLDDAINAVLSFLDAGHVDKAGSFIQGDGVRLAHGDTSIPGNCASKKGG